MIYLALSDSKWTSGEANQMYRTWAPTQGKEINTDLTPRADYNNRISISIITISYNNQSIQSTADAMKHCDNMPYWIPNQTERKTEQRQKNYLF